LRANPSARGGWSARTAASEVVLSRGPLELEGAERPPVRLDLDRPVRWSGGWALGAVRIEAAEAHRRLGEPDAGRAFALLDAEEVEEPLTVRCVGVGQRIRPFGLDGSRLVRDVLAEDGVPRPARAGWPMVVDASGRVVWIPGVRAGATAPLRSGSEAALLLYTVAAPGLPDRTALERS
jgi:tRNA(Ile)-lysidine synthetase-like protein